MSDESRRKRKCVVICLLALFIGLIGIVLPEQEDIAFEVLLNNTELCQYNHTLNRCTGERNTSTTYWANDSAIQIFLMSHANSVGANASVQLFINGTQIEHVSGRPLAAAEDNYKSITAIIPKGANYSATFLNFHHYEWREYPILSGKNGTLSINQTVVGGTGSQNLSQVLTQGNKAINQSINFTDTNTWLSVGYNPSFGEMEINSSSNIYFKEKTTYLGFVGLGWAYATYNDRPIRLGTSTINSSKLLYNDTHGTTWRGNGIRANRLNITAFDKVNMYQTLDMNNNSITNCSNCGGNQNLSQVLTQGNNANLQNINNVSGINTSNTITVRSSINLPWDFVCFNSSCIPRYFAYSNIPDIGNYFVGIRYRANQTFPQPVQRNDTLFRIAGAGGYDTSGTSSGSAIWIDLMAAYNWSSTSTPGKMEILTVPNGSTTRVKRISLEDTGEVYITNLTGAGNAYVCVDTNGRLFRGTPGC